jgi:glycosyltransferase involved in cell wall biosynthesis
VPLAVDETVFRPRVEDARQTTRRELEIPVAAPLLLYVGRLNVQKNLHALLRLLAEVRRTIPEARLCLVGEEDDIVLEHRSSSHAAWG